MSYLNYLKTKLEKQEETNSAAMMGGDDYFIREVDEYSEETHSDDIYVNTNPNKQNTKLLKGQTETYDYQSKFKNNMDDFGKSRQKRINELLNSRFMPSVETTEKMVEKIQEITEIVR